MTSKSNRILAAAIGILGIHAHAATFTWDGASASHNYLGNTKALGMAGKMADCYAKRTASLTPDHRVCRDSFVG